MRVIPVGGDPKAVLEEIQRVWPHLRKNPIQVVTPTSPEETPPSPKETPKNESGSPGPPGNPGESGTASAPADGKETTSPESLPPVVVMLGEESITVASDDPEALDQFAALIHTIVNRGSYSDRYFSIFPIKNTSATAIAEKLREFFRTSSSARASSSSRSSSYRRSPGDEQTNGRTARGVSRVTIVPDERLNMIMVQGSRTDRAKIESLLKVLDTDEVPPTLEARKPKLIPIKNMEAARVAKMLQNVFQSRLAASGGTLGSASAGQRPQLTVDELTNSLIVTAPAPLIDDITELALSLDRSVDEDPARSIRFILLKRTSTARVQEALDAILNRGTPAKP